MTDYTASQYIVTILPDPKTHLFSVYTFTQGPLNSIHRRNYNAAVVGNTIYVQGGLWDTQTKENSVTIEVLPFTSM